MTSQESFIWLQYAQLYENEQKETKKSLIETTIHNDAIDQKNAEGEEFGSLG